MSYLSYPVRWQVIALSTLLTALQCSISVSRFCDQSLYLVSIIGGMIGTDTGCAGCRRAERTVSCEEHIPGTLLLAVILLLYCRVHSFVHCMISYNKWVLYSVPAPHTSKYVSSFGRPAKCKLWPIQHWSGEDHPNPSYILPALCVWSHERYLVPGIPVGWWPPWVTVFLFILVYCERLNVRYLGFV